MNSNVKLTALLRSLILLASFIAVSLQVHGQADSGFRKFLVEGRTMGTTYQVTYFDAQGVNLKKEIDSVLLSVNAAINHYDPDSEVSVFNRSAKGSECSEHFSRIFKRAQEISLASGGAFDVTIAPLVNIWGFGPVKVADPPLARIDSVRGLIGFNKVNLTGRYLSKTDPRVQIDFGGIGQGFGADVIAEFLESRNIRNFVVEIGGEGIGRGTNIEAQRAWQIGILDPNSTRENQFFRLFLKVHNKAFTTSGDYFNYKLIDGKKYGHTIDPQSGYPVVSNLLSATVFADDCTSADGWATAFMVMGLNKSIEVLKENGRLDAILIYSTEEGHQETYMTPGIESFLIAGEQ